MKQLRLRQVNDLTFGRHRGFSLNDLDHEFVVIYGPNETGKSTLAEFLTWSIGGPFRSAANGSDRFSVDGVDRIGGRVEALLDTEALSIDARFKIRARDVPNDFRKGTLGGRALEDAKAFSVPFQELTAADYVLIYRIYGVELSAIGDKDSENDFSSLFSRFASGGSSSTLQPREQVEALAKREKELVDARKKCDGELKNLATLIRDAEKRPAQVLEEQRRIQELVDRIAEIARQLEAVRSEQALIKRVLDGVGALRRQAEAKATLDSLATVPVAWGTVLPSVPEIKRLRGELDDVQTKRDTARTKAAAAVARTGLTVADIAGKQLSAAERAQLQGAGAAVRSAVSNQSDAQGASERLAQGLERLESQIDSVAASVGLSREQAGALANQSGRLDALNTEALQWANAAGAESDARAAVAEAEAALQVVRDNAPPPPPPPPPPPVINTGLNPFVVAAVVAVVGVLALVSPWASLAAGVVAAGVFAVLRSNRKAAAAQPAPVVVAPTVAPPEVGFLSVRMGLLANAESAERDLAQRMRNALGEYGVPLPSPATASALVTTLKQLGGLVDQARAVAHELDAARSAAVTAEELVASSRSVFVALLRERNADAVVSVESFDEWLVDYENALQASDALHALEQQCATLDAKLAPLLAPIAAEVQTVSWPAVLDRFASYAQLSDQRNAAEQALREADIAVTGAGMAEPVVQDVLARHPMGDGLLDRVPELSAQIAALEEERTTATEERTLLAADLEAALQNEVLSGLLLTKGQVEEARAEIEQELQVVQIARELLTTAIDDFEKQNQDPVIQHAQRLVEQVAPSWGTLMMTHPAGGKPVIERAGKSGRLVSDRLSDGARALLHLGIRLAFAERDADRRGLALPLICDDPFAHFDDERTLGALQLLRDTSSRHQVILFTCETATRGLAADLGAHVINL